MTIGRAFSEMREVNMWSGVACDMVLAFGGSLAVAFALVAAESILARAPAGSRSLDERAARGPW